MKSLLDDMKLIDKNLESEKSELQNKRIFLTGGTGFIGKWLLHFFKYLDKHCEYNISVSVLTRDAKKFRTSQSDLLEGFEVSLIEGDVLTPITSDEEFDYVIHGATDASAYLTENFPLKMFETVVIGTKNTLDFAVRCRAKKFLHMSSGAVYGNQPYDLEKVAEDYIGAPIPTDVKATYAEAKRASEMLCAIYAKTHNLNFSVARIFAILGPMLSLDIHFAAGNFLRDAMGKRKIIIKGNGLPIRSYIYPTDLVEGLLKILLKGTSGKAYNVGSEEGISIKHLASLVSRVLNSSAGVEILGREDSGWNLGRYVPSTKLIEDELGFTRNVTLEECILKTAVWNGWKREVI